MTVLFQLAKNPEKQEKLRKEIFEKLPNKDSEITAETLKNMPYLRACMKEAARKMPVVVGNVRAIGQDLVLQGYKVPKGTNVALVHMLLQNDEAYFNKADKFLPERWLKTGTYEEVESSKTSHPFIYMPFGFGPRSCVGRRLAELEQEIFILRIFRNFKVEWHYPDMKYLGRLLNTPGGDIKFRFVDI